MSVNALSSVKMKFEHSTAQLLHRWHFLRAKTRSKDEEYRSMPPAMKRENLRKVFLKKVKFNEKLHVHSVEIIVDLNEKCFVFEILLSVWLFSTNVLGVDDDRQLEIELVVELNFFILENDQKCFAHGPIVENTSGKYRVVRIVLKKRRENFDSFCLSKKIFSHRLSTEFPIWFRFLSPIELEVQIWLRNEFDKNWKRIFPV